jgi:hypothetical protein
MIPLSTTALTERHDFPYRWARVWGLLEEGFAGRLAETFPVEVLRDSHSPQGHYRLRDCTLVDEGRPADVVAGLAEPWRELVAGMVSAEYRTFVEQLTGTDLGRCRLKLRPCEYGPDTWMTAHTDRPDRVATHIIYLSPEWDESWGGGLDVLTSADDDDPAAVVASVWPRFNTSVLFARSDNSFHAVRRVSPHARLRRRTVLAQFVADGV